MICKKCCTEMKYYDTVRRILRGRYGKKRYIYVKRYKCCICHEIHRDLPANVVPYKQYEYDVIFGVKKGYISSSTYGFEDYPCELTMIRWSSQEIHIL